MNTYWQLGEKWSLTRQHTTTSVQYSIIHPSIANLQFSKSTRAKVAHRSLFIVEQLRANWISLRQNYATRMKSLTAAWRFVRACLFRREDMRGVYIIHMRPHTFDVGSIFGCFARVFRRLICVVNANEDQRRRWWRAIWWKPFLIVCSFPDDRRLSNSHENNMESILFYMENEKKYMVYDCVVFRITKDWLLVL